MKIAISDINSILNLIFNLNHKPHYTGILKRFPVKKHITELGFTNLGTNIRFMVKTGGKKPINTLINSI